MATKNTAADEFRVCYQHSPHHEIWDILSEPCSRWYVPCKTALDFCTGLILLVLASPLIGLLALCVRLSSRGPAFYSQIRLGRFGCPYLIYKLRTMTHGCEKQSGPCWSLQGDARATRLGRLLRWTHLDELPQLWNVVRGDMSLIGPRPERPEFLPALERALPNYRGRLAVRPGITGLAQVQLAADTDIESVRRKLAYDLYYTRMLSPWLDVRILLCTMLYLVGTPFHTLRVIFCIPTPTQVERTYAHEENGASLFQHAGPA
jgi:lipopolysaccharide/colanic/teichoic acid biosynthesis glycosyltransferase